MDSDFAVEDINIYKDLESILFKGFISYGFVYNGVAYRFKSLAESEFDYINDKWFFVDNIEDKFKYFLAFSILEINAENLLVVRHESEFIKGILSVINSWPQEFYFKVSKLIDVFRERQSYSSKLLEAYTYTDESRMMWSCYKNMFLNSPHVTGYPGTELFTLSAIQKSWIYINTLEDLRIQVENLNDVGRLSGAAANPEGMKEYNTKETNRRNNLKMYREQVKKNAGYGSVVPVGGISDEELVEQLRRAQRGEKDEHDLIVEQYELNLKRMQLEDKKKLAELLESQKKANEESGFRGFRFRRELLEEAPDAQIKTVADLPITDKQFGAGNARYGLMSPDSKDLKKFSVMAKLDEEEERLLTSDLLDEIKPLNSLTIKEDAVRGPRLDDYLKG